jgi:type II secretion system (T2SS) protein M
VRHQLAARWSKLSPKDRRALALGVIILGTALGVRLGPIPYLHALSEAQERVERERDLLRREQRVLAEVKAYPKLIPRAEDALLHEAPRLFAGPDLATASASLVNYVSTRAVRHRVFVQQSASRTPESAAAGVARLQVDLRAVGDLEGVLALLQDLESGSKLIDVEHLSVAQAERVGSESRDEEVLGVSATMSGYALGDANTTPDSGSSVSQEQAP